MFKVADSGLGEVYIDSRGTFVIVERNLTLPEFIEANITKGRGYVDLNDPLKAPYNENPLKKNINAKIFCYRRLTGDKFPGFQNDLNRGHPFFSKFYFEKISF